LYISLPVGSKEAVIGASRQPAAGGRHRVKRLFYNGRIALSDFSFFPADVS
jgi:hypothetical protein